MAAYHTLLLQLNGNWYISSTKLGLQPREEVCLQMPQSALCNEMEVTPYAGAYQHAVHDKYMHADQRHTSPGSAYVVC